MYIYKRLVDSGGGKVCINGGAGGIGQPLTMLMAMNDSVKEAIKGSTEAS